MARKFGPTQLYAVEEIVNEIADQLVHIGFEVGEAADEQNWDGKGMHDMSGIVDRLLEARNEIQHAIGIARAYEIHRISQEALA
jgi:hypothetical protein